MPWANRKGYEQPFGFGTNVIGVLPGSDPNLAKEIVILAAHYDHLGKGKKGIYHGACDNASGVAVLLEIAEQLVLSGSRPRRPICFASFDCEEKFTLGSFAFTCQKDFEEQGIAAMINVDLLGRDFLNVVGDSLFVVGTQAYPGLRTEVLRAGEKNGVKILPVGTDIVGPRGDHVAFETMEIPVLFFSCGLYKDYHKPTDTAEKLNYMRMKNSAKVIAETVETLANAERIEKLLPQKSGDKDELQTFAYILEKVNSDYEEAGLSAEQGKAVQELASYAKRLLDSKAYTVEERQRFLRRIIADLLPAFAGVEGICAESGGGPLCISELYATHRTVLAEGFRNMVRCMLENKRGLFGKTELKYEMYDLADEEVGFAKTGDGEYALHILLPQFKMSFRKGGWVFWQGTVDFTLSMGTTNCRGSKAEITDFCLLKWSDNLEDESFCRACEKVLKKVTGANLQGSYNDWLQWWLIQSGWTNEQEWVLGLIESDNPSVAALAIHRAGKIARKQAETVIFKIIRDNNVHAVVRASAIWHLDKDVGQKGLLVLVDELDDKTQQDMEYYLSADKSGPLADHPCVKWGIEMSKKWYEKDYKPETLSDLAEQKLKKLTKKNFGKDTKAWWKWITANVK